MKWFFVFTTILVLAMVSSGLLLAQRNPAVGTWRLDLTKSRYSVATPLPKSETRSVEARDDGVKVTYEAVNADGSNTTYGYTATFNGKENSISGTGQLNWRNDQVNGAETIALKRVNTNTYKGTLKKAGKVVSTMTSEVSKDGKVTTITSHRRDAKGQPTTDVSVFNSQ